MKSTGAGTGNKASYSPRLRGDGRWLLFRSQATDLVAGSFSGAANLFLRDLQTGSTRALTTSAAGSVAATPDGRFIGFVGGANCASTSPFLYLWDTALAARVCTNAKLGVTNLATSSDGNRLAYVLRATLRVADRALRTDWTLATLSANSRTQPRLSSDGQVLLFQSWSPELASTDFNRTGDVLAYSFATAVLLPAAAPGQGPWISWPALFGNQYRVEFKHDLSDPAWQVLPGSGTNLGLRAFQQDAAAPGLRKFYRVQAY